MRVIAVLVLFTSCGALKDIKKEMHNAKYNIDMYSDTYKDLSNKVKLANNIQIHEMPKIRCF